MSTSNKFSKYNKLLHHSNRPVVVKDYPTPILLPKGICKGNTGGLVMSYCQPDGRVRNYHPFTRLGLMAALVELRQCIVLHSALPNGDRKKAFRQGNPKLRTEHIGICVHESNVNSIVMTVTYPDVKEGGWKKKGVYLGNFDNWQERYTTRLPEALALREKNTKKHRDVFIQMIDVYLEQLSQNHTN